MRTLAPSALVLALVSVFLVAAACSKKSEERTWRPTDHDQPDDNIPVPGAPPVPAADDPEAAIRDIWNGTCAPCHGVTGKGDGPVGRSLRAPDLTAVAFQERATDDEIAKVITNGRGKMPSYQFPPERVQGLVKKVRSLRQ